MKINNKVVILPAGIDRGFYTAALLKNGTVVAWGQNANGQTDTPPGLSNIKSIVCGPSHIAALTNDGKVIVWGGKGRL